MSHQFGCQGRKGHHPHHPGHHPHRAAMTAGGTVLRLVGFEAETQGERSPVIPPVFADRGRAVGKTARRRPRA